MVGLSFINNRVENCRPAGMYLSNVADLTIIGNIIRNTTNEPPLQGGMAIYMANAAVDNAVVRENWFAFSETLGIHMNGDSSVGGDGIQTGHVVQRNRPSACTANQRSREAENQPNAR